MQKYWIIMHNFITFYCQKCKYQFSRWFIKFILERKIRISPGIWEHKGKHMLGFESQTVLSFSHQNILLEFQQIFDTSNRQLPFHISTLQRSPSSPSPRPPRPRTSPRIVLIIPSSLLPKLSSHICTSPDFKGRSLHLNSSKPSFNYPNCEIA